MSHKACPVEISQSEYDEIRKHDYVVLREWESAEGVRFARLQFWGDKEECEDVANTPALVIVPNGVKLICDQAVAVKDLTT